MELFYFNSIHNLFIGFGLAYAFSKSLQQIITEKFEPNIALTPIALLVKARIEGFEIDINSKQELTAKNKPFNEQINEVKEKLKIIKSKFENIETDYTESKFKNTSFNSIESFSLNSAFISIIIVLTSNILRSNSEPISSYKYEIKLLVFILLITLVIFGIVIFYRDCTNRRKNNFGIIKSFSYFLFTTLILTTHTIFANYTYIYNCNIIILTTASAMSIIISLIITNYAIKINFKHKNITIITLLSLPIIPILIIFDNHIIPEDLLTILLIILSIIAPPMHYIFYFTKAMIWIRKGIHKKEQITQELKNEFDKFENEDLKQLSKSYECIIDTLVENSNLNSLIPVISFPSIKNDITK